MSFSWKDRQAYLSSLEENPPELLIIGGGVVGTSIAAHAAEMGLNCALVEKTDLASGSSGNSTGLAHAGLRYLAQGRFFYVFHESRERRRLQEIAPHWVRPFNFVFPVYRGDPFRLWMVRLGTWIYDTMGWLDARLRRRKPAPPHRVLEPKSILERFPGLRFEGLTGATEYFVDAQLQDSRFTLGWAQKAAQKSARIMTSVEVTALKCFPDGVPQTAVCFDRLSGKSFEIKTPLLINATGAWIDSVRVRAGLSRPVVSTSRGIHLIVDHIVSSPLIFSTEVPGRVFFILPIDSDRSLVGTTDTPCEGSPDETEPQAAEIQELIRRLFHFFPYLKQGTHLMEAIELYKQVHVRDIFWGVRPLLRQSSGAIHEASREHALLKDSQGFWSVPGVKLTAARGVGYQVASQAWKQLRKRPVPQIPETPLPGGDIPDYERYVDDARRRFRLGRESGEIISHLVSTYGSRYVEVLQWAQREPHYSERLVPDEPWILAEVAYAAHEEMVLSLNDFLWRRVKWAHYKDLSQESLLSIAQILGQFLGWSKEDHDTQLGEFWAEFYKHRPHRV